MHIALNLTWTGVVGRVVGFFFFIPQPLLATDLYLYTLVMAQTYMFHFFQQFEHEITRIIVFSLLLWYKEGCERVLEEKTDELVYSTWSQIFRRENSPN